MRGPILAVPFVAFALIAAAYGASDIPLPARKPGTVAKAPPVTWSAEEISRAQEDCARLLIPIELVFEPLPPLRENACGAPVPILLKALGSKAQVRIQPPAKINCALAAKLSDWLTKSVQPLAKKILNSPISEIHNVASYACRNRYNDPSKRLSEHALANALDVAAFKTADGKWIRILDYWGLTERDLLARAQAKAEAEKKAKEQKAAGQKASEQKSAPDTAALLTKQSPEKPSALKVTLRKSGELKQEAALTLETKVDAASNPDPRTIFVRKVHEDACRYFGTVLGPEANNAHRNHFHLDLAPRKRSAYCE